MRSTVGITVLLGLLLLLGCGSGGSKSNGFLELPGTSGAGGDAPIAVGMAGARTAGGGADIGSSGAREAGGQFVSRGGGGGAASNSASSTTQVLGDDCGALAPSSGTVVNISPDQANTLHELMLKAAPGTVFILAPGTYAIVGSLRFEQPNLTLRSSTDRAADVVIDAGYTVAEALVIRASGATVAHVTVTHAVDHAIHVSPPSEGVDITGLLVYGVAMTDNGEQFLKVNPLGDAAGYVDSGRVECSSFLLTDAGRPRIERSVGGCYTGGIDAHAARGWIVRHNRFEGIYCAGEGLAEHAIHFWKRSRATLVENNVIANCARGVGFGMGDSSTGTRVYSDAPYGGDLGHIDGIIRNNVIYADIDYFDTGIEIIQARQPQVLHNTIVSWKGAGFFSSIDYRFGRTQAVIQNNLVRRITVRDGASGTVDHNLQNVAEAYFIAPTQGDFHLSATASDAIDRGVVTPESGLDIDGEPHSRGAPDLGADEQ